MSSDSVGAQESSGQIEASHIEIQNMRKTFGNGSIIACENIDLQIGQDEFVVLLGPSGCGKTTTLRCISGLEIPDSGSILIDGRDVTNRKPKNRDLAFVFQNIALFPHMTVRENIRFGLDMKTDMGPKEKESSVQEVAETLGIRELLDRTPDELSGGQQQRVSLGRAMVMEPEAFLLDEPFSALDANLRDKMRVEIKKLQRQLETSMVFVTHDQEEAMTLGDKIVVMNGGHIMQIGTPYEIFNEPQNTFVAEFIGSPSTNMIECRVRRDESGVVLENDLFAYHLSDESAQGFPLETDDVAYLAVRPEYVTLDDADGLFDATITVVEPHGSRDAVFLSADREEIRSVVPQGEVPMERENETVSIGFERDQVWIFDGEDRIGQRVV